jgi:predicted metal-binding protein
MGEKTKIGIIICHRYHTCGWGKCFRALYRREGAFSVYQNNEVELVGFTTCDGCPGGNIESAPEEMKKNGAQVIHLATGMLVGYPPCPYVSYFRDFIREKFSLKVVVGTHPIPEKYYKVHKALDTWGTTEWRELIQPTVTNEKTRLAYD